MPLYVMVSADFPNITAIQRDGIFACLKEKRWVKITNIGKNASATWYTSFKDDVKLTDAINETIDDFKNCSKPHSDPILAIHTGPNKPKAYNCYTDVLI